MCDGDEKYGGELDGDRNADARPDLPDDVELPPLHLGTAHREIDRDRVDVELDCRGSRLLETRACSIHPSDVVPFRLAITGISSASDARCSVSRCPDTPPS